MFSHLTSLAVLHYLAKQETQNCNFSLKHCMLLCQQTHKTHLYYHLVAVKLPLIPKVIDCMHQTIKTYLEREHSILLSVTHTLHVYQVCHGVVHCVKDGSCFSSSLEWKLMDNINGISYTHNLFTALFPGQAGWAGARRELLDFMVQGKTNRGRH